MLYVKHIRSNIKGGVKADLAPVTLITGPNNSKKTAIINAVELALSKRISVIGGTETIAKEATLLQFAPPNASCLFAEATLSDGTKAIWKADIAGGKIKKATHELPSGINPEEIFTVRNVINELSKTSKDSVRTWFLSQVAVDDRCVTDLADKLLSGQHKEVFANMWSIMPGASIADRLESTYERFKALAREASSQVLASKRVLENIGSSWNVGTSRSLESIRAEITALDSKGVRIFAEIVRAKNFDRAANDIETATQDLAQLANNLKEVEAKLASCEDTNIALIDAVLLITKRILDTNKQTCSVCGYSLSQEDYSTLKARLDKLTAMTHCGRDTRETLKEEQRDIEIRIGVVTEKKNVAEKLLADGKGKYTLDQLEAGMEKVKAQLADLHKQESEALAISTKTDMIKRVTDEISEHKRAEIIYKELVDTTKQIIDLTVSQAVKSFVDRVCLALPPDYQFSFNPGENSFGLKQGDRVFDVLTLSDALRVQLMYAIAVASSWKKAHPLKIAIPEDRAFDADTLRDIVDSALAHADHCQTIFATVASEKDCVYSGRKDLIRINTTR